MTEPTTNEAGPARTGVVEQLVRDDVERKRFLKMAGRRMGGAGRGDGAGGVHCRVRLVELGLVGAGVRSLRRAWGDVVSAAGGGTTTSSMTASARARATWRSSTTR